MWIVKVMAQINWAIFLFDKNCGLCWVGSKIKLVKIKIRIKIKKQNMHLSTF